MKPIIRRRVSVTTALSPVAVVVIPNTGQASSDAAWRAFRQDVARACRQAAQGMLRIEDLTVDPWGSAHYGLARFVGTVP